MSAAWIHGRFDAHTGGVKAAATDAWRPSSTRHDHAMVVSTVSTFAAK